jgi:uncharacterized membrane protein YraQ (UPF0718 family)
MTKKVIIKNIVILAALGLFSIFSSICNFQAGIGMMKKFSMFSKNLVLLLPTIFILLGLFQVWIKRETIEKHLGVDSGLKGIVWAILLASTSIGGLYVALPVAHTLFQKGARLSVLFTYIGASALCRIPMTIFEASFTSRRSSEYIIHGTDISQSI